MDKQAEKANGKEYPDVLVTIADHVAEFLRNRFQVSELDAAREGLECAEVIRKVFGGEAPYFAKGVLFDLSKRDAEILEKLETTSISEVVKEYGLCRRRIYQILHSVRKGKQTFLDFGDNDDDGSSGEQNEF